MNHIIDLCVTDSLHHELATNGRLTLWAAECGCSVLMDSVTDAYACLDGRPSTIAEALRAAVVGCPLCPRTGNWSLIAHEWTESRASS